MPYDCEGRKYNAGFVFFLVVLNNLLKLIFREFRNIWSIKLCLVSYALVLERCRLNDSTRNTDYLDAHIFLFIRARMESTSRQEKNSSLPLFLIQYSSQNSLMAFCIGSIESLCLHTPSTIDLLHSLYDGGNSPHTFGQFPTWSKMRTLCVLSSIKIPTCCQEIPVLRKIISPLCISFVPTILMNHIFFSIPYLSSHNSFASPILPILPHP